MPTLDQHKATNFIKLLVIADSGGGKTGALASLAKAGYDLWIVDTDGNLGVLVDLLRSDPAALKRIHYETCVDKLKSVGGNIVLDGPPQAFAKVANLLTNWPDKGPLEKWTDRDVLVIDTITTLGQAAMRYILALAARDQAQLQDWGVAMDRVEKIIQMVASPAVNCHVVVNSHINYTESAEGSGVIKGYPSALGNKLSPKIPIYFESVLILKTSGSGELRKREFHTKGDAMVEGKSLTSIPAKLPQDTGLAEFFRLARGGKIPTQG